MFYKEAGMEIILGIIAAGLFLLFVIYIVLPVASVAGAIAVIAGVICAFIISVRSFASSLKANSDPYQTYKDDHRAAAGGIRRNYCFGPGFHQIRETVKGAFDNLTTYQEAVTDWKDSKLRGLWYTDIWISLGSLIAIAVSGVLGFIWMTFFSVIMAAVITAGMGVFFLFFSLLWTADRALLVLRSIHSRCPKCKRKSVIPVYICPSCGKEHVDLVPGPYGVIRRKCTCGAMLPTTSFSGRYKLEARCPYCGEGLHSNGSRQFGIQMVGGIGTGKTTYLAAFWHEYRKHIERAGRCQYTEMPAAAFTELEDWYQKGIAEATTSTNANMYSLIHYMPGQPPVQMSVYDIAGEAYDLEVNNIQQQQFSYCEGFVAVIDPTSEPGDADNAFISFINYVDSMKGKHAAKISEVPVAVIISKADLFKREIGPVRIRTDFRNTFGRTAESEENYDEFRSEVCRAFLCEHGYENAVNLIEGEFENVLYFPVSAMGHSIAASKYEPWGVLDPVMWIMKNTRCPIETALA